MSQWKVRNHASSGGLTFSELVRSCAVGELSPDDFVSSDGGMTWQSLDSVVGLEYAVKKYGKPANERSVICATESLHTGRTKDGHGLQGTTRSPQIIPQKAVRIAPGVVWVFVAMVVACGYFLWATATRIELFPQPIQKFGASPQRLSIPWLGRLSPMECMLLYVDAVAVAAVLAVASIRLFRR